MTPRDVTDSQLRWLLAGDPAIAWQALRDLAHADDAAVAAQRDRVAREGWGARLLRKQGRDGRWAGGQSSDGGLYLPKWTSTTYSMLLLRDFGLSPDNARARLACLRLLDEGLQAEGGIAYGGWAKAHAGGETCVTGMILSIVSYFELEDRRVDRIVSHLLREQMADGGWNCQRSRGATHASMHTTISVLEGLSLYGRRRRNAAAVRKAQRRGREFLLEHRLFRSHRTGRIIRPDFLRMPFPPRWHYDTLRALDYFRSVGAPRDARLAEAVERMRARQGADGRWPLDRGYKGKVHFEIERAGAASRWNTLRALRVLRWWQA